MKSEEFEILARALAGENPSRVIEEQEARGQQTMARTSVLPKDGSGDVNRAKLEAMGIQFHEDADDLFVKVTLPPGWQVVPTNHSMHSDLVDERGNKRAGIFYKAAFYDRSAHLSLYRRFSARWEPICGYDKNYQPKCLSWVERVYDGKNPIWQSDLTRFASDHECYQHDDSASVARAWLTEHYPGWEDVLAHWDLPAVEPVTAITWEEELP